MTTKLTAISSRAWEHPADRAALNALRALPGFDEALRRIMGFLGERGVRQLFLANAVRVGPNQRAKLNSIYSEVLETLDAPERDRKSTRLNSSHRTISYAVFCLK